MRCTPEAWARIGRAVPIPPGTVIDLTPLPSLPCTETRNPWRRRLPARPPQPRAADGTRLCRTCREPVPTDNPGRPREFCDRHQAPKHARRTAEWRQRAGVVCG